MGIIYHCFWECSNSLAMYFLSAECGFMKTRKEAMGVAEVGSDRWQEFWWSQGQGRGEVSSDTEMETERHQEEKELVNLLQLQGFHKRTKGTGLSSLLAGAGKTLSI